MLTGILGLDLKQMWIGSLPFVFSITPTVAAGSFFLLSSQNDPSSPLYVPAEDEETWEAAKGSTMALASLIQTGLLIGGLAVIYETVAANRAELEAEPDDEAVKVTHLTT